MAGLAELLDRRVVFVTGKGGTGKTTVCAALALAAAGRGRRVVVCEVGAQDRVAALLGDADGVATQTIDPDEALRAWLARQLRSGAVAGAIQRTDLFRYFAAAAPGVREMATITHVWTLAEDDGAGDLVVVDLPASGHGLGLLRIARTFAEVTRVGPIAAQARAVRDAVEDTGHSALVAVAQADELAVTETLELERAAAGQLRRRLDAVVVNAVAPDRWRRADLEALDGVAARVPATARRAVRAEAARARAQRAQLRRLRHEGDARVVTLPALATPEVGPEHVAALARRLAG